MSYSYKKVIKPKSNKQSSSKGGQEAAKNKRKSVDVNKKRQDAYKDWPWWIPK